MCCIYYQNDSLHTLSETEIIEHIKICSACAERISFENEIEKQANYLKPFKPDDGLWGKIEIALEEKTSSKNKNIFQLIMANKNWLSAAAVFFLLVSSTLYFLTIPDDSNILSYGALLRVEYTENNYMEAIEELEEKAQPVMAGMDTDLMFLYRDKLETIQTQINKCREAIDKNPGNAHIRRYMLAALRDKKETLNEILNFQGI